ncbi:MAG: hypothetical protein QF872_04105 [Gammaproteobacteria bacterium]|nr:hypothetical protein [Gammaproteobacteria bacterium]
MISIYLHELPFEPALTEYWPGDICGYDEVESYSELPGGDYDAYEFFEPMEAFFSKMAISSSGAELEHQCLEIKDQFEYVLTVLDSGNSIPCPEEPSMVSVYSNTEIRALINSLVEVKVQYVHEEWHEHVEECLITMISFLAKCNMNGHAVAVCSTG